MTTAGSRLGHFHSAYMPRMSQKYSAGKLPKNVTKIQCGKLEHNVTKIQRRKLQQNVTKIQCGKLAAYTLGMTSPLTPERSQNIG